MGDRRPGYFTDADHSDHLHVGFKQAIDPSWKPPAGRHRRIGGRGRARRGGGDTRTGDRRQPRHAVVRGGARGGRAGDASRTLSFQAVPAAAGGPPPPAEPAAATGRGGGGAAPAPPGAPPAPPTAPADPALTSGLGQEAAARSAADGVTEPAGPKALAALAEALKYKGTPYLWGGSNPETGFDCSGLVQWAYAKQGIQTGRTTYDQIASRSARRSIATSFCPATRLLPQRQRRRPSRRDLDGRRQVPARPAAPATS